MDYMNVYYVHVVQHLAQVIGGIQKVIWVQPFLCKHIDGLWIQEMNTQNKDYNY
jgi:hypothetical protein